MKKMKMVFYFLVFIVFFTSIVIGIRFYRIYSVNSKFTSSMIFEEDAGEGLIKYDAKNNGYVFYYAPASFLYTDDCFASVCTEEDTKMILDNDGNLSINGTRITLFIWPFSGECGLTFHFIKQGKQERIQIYVDKKLNCLSEVNSRVFMSEWETNHERNYNVTSQRERKLIRKLKNRQDKAAAEELIQNYYKEIYAYVFRQTGHKETAMDLTQEIFLGMLQGIGFLRNCFSLNFTVNIHFQRLPKYFLYRNQL